ncbi:hypothetical protein MZO42_08705 [Sphingomonas psychrotolerans]|uniref:Uncharacterized protein n=1 Tax=Sphingomonas psychrotolerans TaxID=1327635 RepID=A0ABU3N4S8_9SPHN|nr:hypothetical protein [Sphingomonas psychrotolerans]MDT8758777.1 hypothetical protein [Sphingomonas psychrotolerans]
MISMKRKAAGRGRLAATTAPLLMAIWGAHAQAQQAPADPDFEAALRSTQPSRRAADDDFEKGLARTVPQAAPASRSGTRGASGGRRPIAPAGALPAHWRGRTTINAQLWRQAEEEAEQGLLDPHAFVQFMFGKLPLPPGATPIRCRKSIARIWFTLGKDVPSAEYANLLAMHEKNGGKSVFGQPSFIMGHLPLAEKATASMRAELGRYFASIGYRRIPDSSRAGRDVYQPVNGDPDRSFQIGIYSDAYMEQQICNSYAPGVKLPTGPIMELRVPRPPN